MTLTTRLLSERKDFAISVIPAVPFNDTNSSTSKANRTVSEALACADVFCTSAFFGLVFNIVGSGIKPILSCQLEDIDIRLSLLKKPAFFSHPSCLGKDNLPSAQSTIARLSIALILISTANVFPSLRFEMFTSSDRWKERWFTCAPTRVQAAD